MMPWKHEFLMLSVSGKFLAKEMDSHKSYVPKSSWSERTGQRHDRSNRVSAPLEEGRDRLQKMPFGWNLSSDVQSIF